MSNGQRKYTVIELADIVGVPRTTVNDWLSRHSQYIDFRTQGRRRIYTDASVEVLKEIAALRNSGLSSFDIDEELAKRHPVHGEPAPNPSSVAASSEGDASCVPEEDSQRGYEEFSLIAKRQSDEIGRLIADSFQGMTLRMERIEECSRQANAKAMRWYSLSICLLAALLVCSFVAILKMEDFSSRNKMLEREVEDRTAAVKSLQDKVFSLAGGSEEMKRNIEALEMGLVRQKSDFERTIGEANSSLEKKEAEIAKLRDLYAASRLELMKVLTSPSSTKEQRDDALKKLGASVLSGAKNGKDTPTAKPNPTDAAAKTSETAEDGAKPPTASKPDDDAPGTPAKPESAGQ